MQPWKKSKDWAVDLINRYDKKYRKYLGKKPMIPYYNNNLTGLQNQTGLMQAAQNQMMWITNTATTTNIYSNVTTGTGMIYGNNVTIPPGCYVQVSPTTMQPLPYNPGIDSPTPVLDRILKIRDGQACDVQLPDGSTIRVAESGSYVIDDKDAKVVYRANRARDFNRFINVSDRIEEFFEFCGEQDVRSEEMMELPMKLFVGWLVLKAAEADLETPPEDIKLIPDLRRHAGIPRCRSCGRFISHEMKKADVEFCRTVCFDKKLLTFKPRSLLPPAVIEEMAA